MTLVRGRGQSHLADYCRMRNAPTHNLDTVCKEKFCSTTQDIQCISALYYTQCYKISHVLVQARILVSLKTMKPNERLGRESELLAGWASGTSCGRSLSPTSSSRAPFRRTESEERSPPTGESQYTSLSLVISSLLRSWAITREELVLSSSRTILPAG